MVRGLVVEGFLGGFRIGWGLGLDVVLVLLGAAT